VQLSPATQPVPAALAGRVRLSGAAPFARGGERAVYAHPEDPGLVLKVVVGRDPTWRPFSLESLARRLFPERLRLRRAIKEIDGYRRAFLGQPLPELPFPAAEFRGLLATDIGPAVAFEMLRGPDGGIAQPLSGLPRARLAAPDAPRLFETFAERVVAWELIASDLTASNIVLADRGAGPELVLVDGIGAPHLVPLRYWSRWLNRRELLGRLTRLAAGFAPGFDPATLRFRPGGELRPQPAPPGPGEGWSGSGAP